MISSSRFKALLFIPSSTPYDFYTREYEKGLEGDGALGGGGDGGQRGLPIAEFLPVEGVVLLLLHLGAGTLPQGDRKSVV